MGARARVWRAGIHSARAFTLVEVLIVIALIAVLSSWAVPAYLRLVSKAKNAQAIYDITRLQHGVFSFARDYGEYPDSLEDLETTNMPLLDPWGGRYQYLTPNFPGWKGKFRKDRFLVPLNSDYDLYSSGPDGASRPPLRAKASRDDIVRANNGGYIGKASEF